MRWLFGRRDRDLDEEIRTHLAMAEGDRIDRGEDPAAARAHARREFGNAALVRQVARELSPWHALDQFGQDVRVALRRLMARPATTLTAIVMLGLAVGITTAMFTLVDAFLIRPLPFPDADRIGHVWMRSKTGGSVAVDPAVLRAWRASAVFEAAEGVSPEQVVLDTGQGPTVRASAFVSPGMLPMLGATPIRGRLFQPGEGRSGTSDRVVISEDLWRSAFGADSDLVGRRITLGTESVVVIGILPHGFRFPAWNTQIWRPIDYDVQPPGPFSRPRAYLKVAAGVPDADALRAATSAAHAADPGTARLWAERMPPVDRYSGTQYADVSVRLLVGGVALVFLVLCANASSLLLARFSARRRDFSLCAALGASRGRLLWQSALESTFLGAAAALAGVALAAWLVSAAAALLPTTFVVRSLNPLDLDGRALGAAALLAFIATVLAGWVPAWVGTRAAQPLRTLDRGASETRAARVLARGLLVAEVTLASALLFSAGLLVKSFVNLSQVDLGFDPRGIVEIWMSPKKTMAADDASRQAAFDEATAALVGLPGVRHARRFGETGKHWYGLHPDRLESNAVDAQFLSFAVDAAWFEMYGIQFVRGRTFLPDEPPDHVILGERLASLLWPNGDPIGRAFYWRKQRHQVVGIVRERTAPVKDLEADFTELYTPLTSAGGTVSLECGERCPSEGLIRQRLLDAGTVDVHAVRQLEEIYREELAQPRAIAALGATFGALALAVAAGGLFSVLSHAVGRRRREFGIRLALGSSPAAVRRLVLADGARVAVAGVALGALAAWLLARTLGALLYGVTPADPWTWTIVLSALALATLAGAWRPAAQAMRVDPVALLREE